MTPISRTLTSSPSSKTAMVSPSNTRTTVAGSLAGGAAVPAFVVAVGGPEQALAVAAKNSAVHSARGNLAPIRGGTVF